MCFSTNIIWVNFELKLKIQALPLLYFDTPYICGNVKALRFCEHLFNTFQFDYALFAHNFLDIQLPLES